MIKVSPNRGYIFQNKLRNTLTVLLKTSADLRLDWKHQQGYGKKFRRLVCAAKDKIKIKTYQEKAIWVQEISEFGNASEFGNFFPISATFPNSGTLLIYIYIYIHIFFFAVFEFCNNNGCKMVGKYYLCRKIKSKTHWK